MSIAYFFSPLLALGCLIAALQGGELITLDGQRFEGSIQWHETTLGVTLTNGLEQQVAWSNLLRARFADVSAQSTADSASQLPGVTINPNRAVRLNQSVTDALNGIVGMYVPRKAGERAKPKPRPYLTDAVSSTRPGEQPGWFAGEVTWDLGIAMPAGERQLDSVSIWIWGEDEARGDYAGWLEISEDGENFMQVPGTATAIDFGHMVINRSSRLRYYNQVLYTFGPGTVQGFRYLRLNAETPQTTWCDTRFLEVDAFVSRASNANLSRSSLILRSGSKLSGLIKSIDGTSVGLEEGELTRKIPVESIAQIHFFRLPLSYMKAMAVNKTGVLLSSGEFLEAEIQKLDKSTVRISSVLFGVREFNLNRGVLAIILHERQPEEAGYHIQTRSGSVVAATSIQPSAKGLGVEETCLGRLSIASSNIVEVQRWTRGTPGQKFPM